MSNRTSKEQLDRDWTTAREAWPRHHRSMFLGCDTDNSWMAGYRAALADARAPDEPKPQPSNERVHDLKCLKWSFDAVSDGSKPFEIRFDDRDFCVDDVLRLREWDPKADVYTGREIRKRVTYVTDFQQHDGYVVMGLAADEPKPQPSKQKRDLPLERTSSIERLPPETFAKIRAIADQTVAGSTFRQLLWQIDQLEAGIARLIAEPILPDESKPQPSKQAALAIAKELRDVGARCSPSIQPIMASAAAVIEQLAVEPKPQPSNELVAQLRAWHTSQLAKDAAQEIERLQNAVTSYDIERNRLVFENIEIKKRMDRLPDEPSAPLKKCPYCLRSADDEGGIFHAAGCAGLEKVELNRLQYDALRRAEPPTDAIDFRALAGRLRKVGGVIRKTYEWQAGELEVIAEDLDRLSPTKNAAPPSAIPFSVRWAMNQLLQDLPKDRDWLNPDIEKIFRQHQWQPETKDSAHE